MPRGDDVCGLPRRDDQADGAHRAVSRRVERSGVYAAPPRYCARVGTVESALRELLSRRDTPAYEILPRHCRHPRPWARQLILLDTAPRSPTFRSPTFRVVRNRLLMKGCSDATSTSCLALPWIPRHTRVCAKHRTDQRGPYRYQRRRDSRRHGVGYRERNRHQDRHSHRGQWALLVPIDSTHHL